MFDDTKFREETRCEVLQDEEKTGAGTQIRTADLLITNQLLCLTELFRQPSQQEF